MRKVQIPLIYSTSTGEWLRICGLTYDDEENIVEVDVWDGEGVITYEKGEFEVDESNIIPLYQKGNSKRQEANWDLYSDSKENNY